MKFASLGYIVAKFELNCSTRCWVTWTITKLENRIHVYILLYLILRKTYINFILQKWSQYQSLIILQHFLFHISHFDNRVTFFMHWVKQYLEFCMMKDKEVMPFLFIILSNNGWKGGHFNLKGMLCCSSWKLVLSGTSEDGTILTIVSWWAKRW